MKTIVLTFSKVFPAHHVKKGQDTNFVNKILENQKTTTIRSNYYRWRKICQEVNAGKAILSLRYWTDKPYRSKQKEFAICDKIEVLKVFITNDDFNGFEISVDHKYCDTVEFNKIVETEGFNSSLDFADWFKDEEFSGALIKLKNVTPCNQKHTAL